MNEQIKSFWFYIEEDTRTGRKLYTYENPPIYKDGFYDEGPDNLTPEMSFEVNFTIPKEGMRLFIANVFMDEGPLCYMDIDEDEDIGLLYEKIFSHIYGVMPFKVTGTNSAYVQQGYCPKIPDEIKALPLPKIIDDNITKIIKNRKDGGYYFMFVIDDDGDECMTELLGPI